MGGEGGGRRRVGGSFAPARGRKNRAPLQQAYFSYLGCRAPHC